MKIFAIVFFLFISYISNSLDINNFPKLPRDVPQYTNINNLDYTQEELNNMYDSLKLNQYISNEAFIRGVEGMSKINIRKNNIIAIVDFTKPSTQERMCILDLDNKELLITSYVAHGKGSGNIYPTEFSNTNGSNKSCIGFFITGSNYDGINGNSLSIYGLEKGKNDKSRERDIVIHGADYAEEEFIKKYSRLGRSWGCFAVPRIKNDIIIDAIKNGSIMYAHYEKK